MIQELLIQKSGESPAQIAVSAGHKSAGIVSIKVFCIETQSCSVENKHFFCALSWHEVLQRER